MNLQAFWGDGWVGSGTSIPLPLAVVEPTANTDPPLTPQILEAARAAGSFVPTLCAHPGIPARGTCRICLVELETGAGTKTVGGWMG